MNGPLIDNGYTAGTATAAIALARAGLALRLTMEPLCTPRGCRRRRQLLPRATGRRWVEAFCFEPITHPIDAFHLPGRPGLRRPGPSEKIPNVAGALAHRYSHTPYEPRLTEMAVPVRTVRQSIRDNNTRTNERRLRMKLIKTLAGRRGPGPAALDGRRPWRRTRRRGISMPTKSAARWIADGDNMVKVLQGEGLQGDLQYATTTSRTSSRRSRT